MSTHRFTERTDWFAMQQVSDGIFHVTEPFYRADYRCNIYIVKGRDRDIVIDTGLGLASLKEFIAPVTQNPLLVCSHSHYDHMGSNWEFDQRVIHPTEADIVAHPTRENTYADPFLETEDFYELPWPDFDTTEWLPQPAPPTGLINEGDVIDLGDRQFKVLSTPGHSWGGVCLWEEESGIMFCADTVYEGELFDFLPCSDIPTYVQTMQCLREFPVRVAFPGHGPLLDAARFNAVIDEYVRCHLQ
jgi:glyoxylase-like metal-dependent hydrolase (beta-lactamase superfamily II)